MKSYLDLVPISAKVHRRQNRMTLLCIIISVFLVTTIFSIADMAIRMETSSMQTRHGNWHLSFTNITKEEAAEISLRQDVTCAGWSDYFNMEAAEPYYIGEKKAVLYGTENAYITRIMDGLAEGEFPKEDGQVMLGRNAKDALGVQVGDRVTLHTPAGDLEYTVSGFGEDDPELYQGQTYLVGVYMTQNAFHEVLGRNGITGEDEAFYVQFSSAKKASQAKKEMAGQYGLADGDISENTGLMGMSGASDNAAMKNVYGVAAVLFVLVLIAGVLMISGSMNSNVTQRTRFFGMMRCIGASRRQIIRFVRREALNWCKTAVPAGVALGIICNWAVCMVLRFGIGGEWAGMPVFAVSAVGVICGIVVGLVTVLLAAQSPAKRAAKVSPVMAVSGGTGNTQLVRHAARQSFVKIESALGIHHAVSGRKNWCLMTCSFAFSIILFLSFSVLLDFARGLLPSLRSWQPDCSINAYANALSLDRGLVDEIREIPGVAHVYGNVYMDEIPASSEQSAIDHVSMVSYDDYMLDCSAKSVVQGNLSEIYGDSGKVMTIYNKNNPLHVGDTIQVAGEELEVACAVSDGLFSDEEIIVCSEETFFRLMGEQNYVLINVQLEKEAADDTVRQIGSLANGDEIFSDFRETNQDNNAFYWVTRLLAYGFLFIIGMITVFYIINSISMSVSARVKQYGAMRAVGMDGRQLTKMIAAEAFTYAVSGLVVGCAAGLALSWFLYEKLVTRYFGMEWNIPAGLLVVILLFVLLSALVAVYAPAKRIRNMPVTETINEL